MADELPVVAWSYQPSEVFDDKVLTNQPWKAEAAKSMGHAVQELCDHATATARIAALELQLRSAKVIIKGSDERAHAMGQEVSLLRQQAADVEGERAANSVLTSELESATARIAELQAEVEALRKDAERYRALRNSLPGRGGVIGITHTEMPMLHPMFRPEVGYLREGLDQAIDAVIQEQKECA